MVFDLNYQYLISNPSYTKPKYFYIFHPYSNSVPDLLTLVYLIEDACMKLKHTKISENVTR